MTRGAAAQALPKLLCESVATLALFQTKIYYFPDPFSDHLKWPLIANPMTFRRGLLPFPICFETECPWSMSK